MGSLALVSSVHLLRAKRKRRRENGGRKNEGTRRCGRFSVTNKNKGGGKEEGSRKERPGGKDQIDQFSTSVVEQGRKKEKTIQEKDGGLFHLSDSLPRHEIQREKGEGAQKA